MGNRVETMSAHEHSQGCMDGWMVGERVGDWVGGWMEEKIDRWTDGWMYRQINGKLGGWMDRRKDKMGEGNWKYVEKLICVMIFENF